eukprot:scaffold3759_cov124-Skeletonema_dohrnii-CCMP3373.AAC.7
MRFHLGCYSGVVPGPSDAAKAEAVSMRGFVRRISSIMTIQMSSVTSVENMRSFLQERFVLYGREGLLFLCITYVLVDSFSWMPLERSTYFQQPQGSSRD